MLTIHLFFVTIRLRLHERTLADEQHYLRVKRQMDVKSEKPIWML
ncbi:hypothetical protein [Guptibacillus hwajinpoensis]|nr:hypothetical protein [Pseudalkalibacillus hwajinpoensis]WLR60647.1 hypothetical protein LC071_04645 [Pseudalkalibacillus hwajinpoensis]